LIQLVEVYNPQGHHGSALKYNLREIFINPKHVVAVRPDDRMKKLLNEGYLPEDMDRRQGFTKLYLDRGQNGIDLTVVGEAGVVSQKLGILQKELLKG
jgi:hypothetical protein